LELGHYQWLGKRFIITWYLDAVRLGNSRKTTSFALCEKNGHIARIMLTPIDYIVIKDVYVNGDCEDGKWCFDLDCPHCKPDLKYLRKMGIKSQEQLVEVHKRFERIREELKLTVKEHGVVCEFPNPVKIKISKTAY